MISLFVYSLVVSMLLADESPEYNETKAGLATASPDKRSSGYLGTQHLLPPRKKREQTESCTGLFLVKFFLNWSTPSPPTTLTRRKNKTAEICETRRSVSVNWSACGMCYTNREMLSWMVWWHWNWIFPRVMRSSCSFAIFFCSGYKNLQCSNACNARCYVK